MKTQFRLAALAALVTLASAAIPAWSGDAGSMSAASGTTQNTPSQATQPTDGKQAVPSCAAVHSDTARPQADCLPLPGNAAMAPKTKAASGPSSSSGASSSLDWGNRPSKMQEQNLGATGSATTGYEGRSAPGTRGSSPLPCVDQPATGGQPKARCLTKPSAG